MISMELLLKISIFIFLRTICIAVDLKDFYPYGELNGDTVLPRGVSQYFARDLITPFYIGNDILSSNYIISTNGYISLDQASNGYDLGVLPCRYDYGNIVAPFLTYTSTLTYGTVQFRETNDVYILRKINQDIRNGTGFLGFDAKNALIATWTDMTFAAYTGNYDEAPLNDFQAVITTDGFYTFAIFYYARISWNQGDYTGDCTGDTNTGIGVSCQAEIGYKIDGSTFCLDGSCSDASLSIANRTNVKRPGVWITKLAVDSNPSKPVSSLKPFYMDMMGHMSMKTFIPDSFNSSNQYSCKLIDILENEYSSIGTIDFASSNQSELSCSTEFFLTYGNAKFLSEIRAENMNYFYYDSAHLFLLPPIPEVSISVLNESVIDYSVFIELNWNALLISQLNPEGDLVNISMHVFDPADQNWKDPMLIAQNVNNSGEVIIKLSQPNAGTFLSKHLVISVIGSIGTDIAKKNGIFSKMFIFDLDNFALTHKRKRVHDTNVFATVGMMGHRKLNITFTTTHGQIGLGCKFIDYYIQFTKAVASADNQYVTCYVPFLYSYGFVKMELLTDYYGYTTLLPPPSTTATMRPTPPYGCDSFRLRNTKKTNKSNKNHVISSDNAASSFIIDVLPSHPRLTVKQSTAEGQFQLQMQFTWDPSDIPPEYPILNAFIYQYNDDTQRWMTAMMVSPQYVQPGAGTATVDLSQDAVTVFFNNKVLFGLGYVQGDEDFVIFSKMYYPGMDVEN